MHKYAFAHDLPGERQRLALMSELLDPMERAHIERLGLQPGWHCLEVGCGTGSISQWLARRVAPGGNAVASDLDIAYISELKQPCLEVRQLDILNDALEENAYDLVVARAVLHHLPHARKAVERMIAALKPGGVLLSIEPYMLACTVAEPEGLRTFWQGWLKWSADAGIDYFIGRKIAPWLAELGLEEVAGEGHTAMFNGGSKWAQCWMETVRELAPSMVRSGHVTEKMLQEFNARFQAPQYWTSIISFTANWGRKAA